MTRINVVPPSELGRLHLIAEYRELPRVFGLVQAAQRRGVTPATCGAPPEYVLGKGHVTFFYPRLGYVVARHKSIVVEMISRGYDPAFPSVEPLIRGIDQHWFGSYVPSFRALAINRRRIEERS